MAKCEYNLTKNIFITVLVMSGCLLITSVHIGVRKVHEGKALPVHTAKA